MCDDDLQRTIFNFAGKLHHLLCQHGPPYSQDYTYEHPITQAVGDFILEVSLPPTIRSHLSYAETTYIIQMTLGRPIIWPKTFIETRVFLTNIHMTLYRIRMSPKVQLAWSLGHLFFGCRRIVEAAANQLKIKRTHMEHLVMCAGVTYMRSSIKARVEHDLVYYILNNDGVRYISMTNSEGDMARPLLCVDLSQPTYITDIFPELKK
ncbi:MAG: hypothetical protein ACOVQN_09380 [Exiguobacterium sp.]|jgi:hypothetical protein